MAAEELIMEKWEDVQKRPIDRTEIRYRDETEYRDETRYRTETRTVE